MKKKRLATNVLLALSVTACCFTSAWAADWEITNTDQGKNIEINTSSIVSAGATFDDQGLNEFKTVTINYTPTNSAGENRALGVYSARYAAPNTKFIITVNNDNDTNNNDAIHLTNHKPSVIIGGLEAYVGTKSSDVFNISRDCTGNGNITVNGDLKAVVQEGNGIRANASIKNEQAIANIDVGGKTDITINADAISLIDALNGVEGVLNPAAVWAGSDADLRSFQVAIGKGQVTLNGETNIALNGKANWGVMAGKNGQINVNNNLTIKSSGEGSYGVAATPTNITYTIDLSGNKHGSNVVLNGKTNIIDMGEGTGSHAIYADADISNRDEKKYTVNSGENFGSLWARGNIESVGYGSEINLTMRDHVDQKLLPEDFTGKNVSAYINGSLMAGNEGSISLQTEKGTERNGSNIIFTSEKLEGDSLAETDKKVVSALYANNGCITLSGIDNTIISSYGNMEKDDSERTVWAKNEGTIDISGETTIIASNATVENSKNSIGMAVVSGLEDWKGSYMDDDSRSHVKINYNGSSSITGDIVAGYGGSINIQPNMEGNTDNDSNTSMYFTGNALAGNDGKLTMQLGDHSYWYGRADDYQDADIKLDNPFYIPQFSNNIEKSGTVDVSLGQGAVWNVTGQSWITNLNGNNSTIILDGEDTGGYALNIGTLTGSNTFVMNVRPDRSSDPSGIGDMLYIMNGTSDKQNLVIHNADQVLENLGVNEAVRFATIKNAGGGFGDHTSINDAGVFNVDFGIVYNDYDKPMQGDVADDSNDYNGEDFGSQKPGTDYVDTVYGDKTEANGMAAKSLAKAAVASRNTVNKGNPVNVYLVRQAATMDRVSDAGKTIMSMSKINYSNAIYMDRLNKRMGEARYLDGDEGLWVRIRHDRIGKSDAFRSKNTMMELGYDKRVDDREDGEHRQGVVLDYMRGTASYDNVIGDGDVRRGGLWLYDTWLGDKGHYSDYVLKFGRLSNNFDIYTRTNGDKIHGDYSNFVYSASAEYGRKKDLGNNWYVEPQTQIQYAHVTDADYTTSQGTQVDLDAIDSLIGRIGFRLGKDLGEKSTFYVKADVLHEFLGDQDISARDTTGLLSTTYENEGTWYDVGIGFSHQFSKGTYMFLDAEKTFGNDNEDTYQFNVGMNWKV